MRFVQRASRCLPISGNWLGRDRLAISLLCLLAMYPSSIMTSARALASDNICTPIPYSSPPAAPNTLIGSTDLGNSNPATELAYVQSLVPNAVEVPCTFTPPNTGTSGTWSSTATVTHVLVKAGTLHQVFEQAAPGNSGVWTTQCIVNNLNSRQPQDLSHGRCYSTSNVQTKVSLKKVTTDGSTSDFTFTSSIGTFDNATLTTTGGTDTAGPAAVTGGAQQTITEQANPNYTLQSASCALSGGATPSNGAGSLVNGRRRDLHVHQ